MRTDDFDLLDDASSLYEDEVEEITTTSQRPRRPSKAKFTSLEARRAVEDFLAMRKFRNTYDELYNF